MVIVRTHKSDRDSIAAYDRYATIPGADVVLCFDERGAPGEPGQRRKVGFDDRTLEQFGLFRHRTSGWLCGDYSYYVTCAAFPGYDVYWLIEPDVFISTLDLSGMFSALNASDADFLAPRFGPRGPNWAWYRRMLSYYKDIYGCIFPITRLSARAIDHLYSARRAASRSDTPILPADWPNDEVFVATELQNNGFVCRELGHLIPGAYTYRTLRTGVPWDRDTLEAQPPDGLIYHPVRRFSAWFEDLSDWAANYGVLRRDGGRAHFRPDLLRLIKLAAASVRHREFFHGGLFPLMLANVMTLEAGYVDEDLRLSSYREAEVEVNRRVQALLEWFGPFRNGRAFATAHLLSVNNEIVSADNAAPGDFCLGDAQPLRTPPFGFALPYAYDRDSQSLLFTVHPLPGTVLFSESALQEQRRLACVGCMVPMRHLLRFYPLPETMPAITFVVAEGAAARYEAAEQLRSLGKRPVTGPPALMQLASANPWFSELPRPLQRALLWAAIAPIFAAYGVTGDIVFVVSGDILRIRRPLSRLLPELRIVRNAGALRVRGNSTRPRT